MNEQDYPPPEPEELSVQVVVEPEATVEPEVELVLPAEAYESIDTPSLGPGDLAGERVVTTREEGSFSYQEIVRSLAELEAGLGGRLDALQVLFEREIRAEATREKVVDRLHGELQEYKQDLLLGTLRPIFIDLIQLHDDIGKLVEAQKEPEAAVERMLELMRGFQQAIEDIMYRQGVEPFASEEAGFDARRQRAVATVPTEHPELARTIAARLRKGFRHGERIIRPELVSVYSLRK